MSMTPRQKGLRDWPVVAGRLAALLPPEAAHPGVSRWARDRKKSERWAVAFSGGADSLALLLLLWAHWPERRERLAVLHFNHRLRGRESVAEEKFCGRVCAALGVELVVGHWAGQHRGTSEAVARIARHAFFADAMKKARTKILWLAHQQDDIAETLFMRLARGSGLGGLAAPRPLQPTGDGRLHVRPLLTVKKADLVAKLREAGAAWCEDSSNQGDDHFRNRVRRAVVPAWIQAAGRDALAGAALSRELLEEDDQALEQWADQVFPAGRERTLTMASLTGLPRAVVRRVLHRWLLRVRPAGELSRQGFERLLEVVERGKATRFSLGPTGFAVIHRGQMGYREK